MKRMIFLSLPLIAIFFLLLGCLHQAQAEDPRKIEVIVTVPDPAWQVTIDEIYVKNDRLLVISTLNRDPEAMAPQVISQTSDSVLIPAPDLPVEHYILGRTFRWAQESHNFIDDPAELREILKSAKRIYGRPNKDSE